MVMINREHGLTSFWQDDFPVTNRYTYGLAGERFFRGLKSGVIYGTRCQSCNITYVPAAAFCERCLSELTDWLDVGIQGFIYTYTQLFVDIDGFPLQNPEIVALIRIADGGIIHKVSGITNDNIHIGQIVEAVFKSAVERQGAITDIQYFKPVSNE